MAIHTLPASHFWTRVIEGAIGKVCYRWRVPRVTTDTITRGRHMVLCFPCCSHPIMTGGTGQSDVCTAWIQCRMVKARGETATGLMAPLAHIRRRRVSGAFADGFHRIAGGMT